MRCLYCGKELALLKRWTRGGQFCSDAHKKSYQEEYNRIGLSRLLQAQNKIAPVKSTQAQEDSQKSPGSAPAHEVPVAVQEAPLDQSTRFEEAEPQTADADIEKHPVEEPAWEPARTAGFLMERGPEPATIGSSAHSEPWEHPLISPLSPAWRSSGEVANGLPQAAVVALKFRPNLSDSERSAPEVKVLQKEFVPSAPVPPAGAIISASNHIASAGLIRRGMIPWTPEWSVAPASEVTLSFPIETEYRYSELLQIALSPIDFSQDNAETVQALEQTAAAPEEHAGGIVAPQIENADAPAPRPAVQDISPIAEHISPIAEHISPIAEHISPIAEDISPAAEESFLWQPAANESAAPTREIEDLARLHDGLGRIDEETQTPETLVVAPDISVPPEQAHSEPATAPGPRFSPRLVEMTVKTFPPSKPTPREGGDALIEMPVFLPRLTGLPLRPKMALVAPPSGVGAKKASRLAAKNASAAPEIKPESKPPAEPKLASEPAVANPPKGWAKAVQPTPARAAVQTAKPESISKRQDNVARTEKIDSTAGENGRRESNNSGKPALAKDASEETVTRDKNAPDQPLKSAEPEIEVPSFGAAAKPGNDSVFSSFTAKLAIAAGLIALCIVMYFVFSGKPQAPAANPESEKSGPSIMVGSGGWVEGWAGDPVDAHYGRQITIYRPSLKLSDYRVDFKGEIETKSLGWVFRATDPENYYALKLAIVTPGLEPKIALLKYLVKHGRETQVGRVPIDQNVRLDTIYTVRVDVRGPKFTTYVQGQLVDTWIDDQLKSGGVGFLNAREERGRIK